MELTVRVLIEGKSWEFLRLRKVSLLLACTIIILICNTSNKLEIRSVERGICPIATSTMNELFSYNGP